MIKSYYSRLAKNLRNKVKRRHVIRLNTFVIAVNIKSGVYRLLFKNE